MPYTLTLKPFTLRVNLSRHIAPLKLGLGDFKWDARPKRMKKETTAHAHDIPCECKRAGPGPDKERQRVERTVPKALIFANRDELAREVSRACVTAAAEMREPCKARTPGSPETSSIRNDKKKNSSLPAETCWIRVLPTRDTAHPCCPTLYSLQ